MATIEEYTSGEICNQVKRAFFVMDRTEGSLKGTDDGEIMLARVRKMAPKKITLDQAVELIQASEKCAVGPRVCLAVHKDARPTESVFLDDLSVGMVSAGKARSVEKKEAIETIRKYRKHPFIVSKVSGRYAELCPTWAKRCVYWNMEKHHLKCIER